MVRTSPCEWEKWELKDQVWVALAVDKETIPGVCNGQTNFGYVWQNSRFLKSKTVFLDRKLSFAHHRALSKKVVT